MHLAYIKKLGFNIQKINVEAQKIDDITLETFEKVIAAFSMHDKAKKICFFKEILLLADISMDVALGMLFLTLSNVDIRFTDWELYWKSNSIFKALPTIYHIELIDQKEFVVAALGKDNKAFIMHIASLAIGTKMTIHSF